MPFPLAIIANLATLLLLTWGVCATPILSFAINSQIPPVAYVSHLFEYAFSPETFRSSIGQEIQYSISDGPQWLSIDSTSRILCGIPSATDLGFVHIELVASDGNGRTSTNVTLVVLEHQTIGSGEDILLQLEAIGNASSPAALLLKPSEPFSFALSRGIFDGLLVNTVFYALSSDGSPLPSWLQFDSSALEFSGTSPPLPASIPTSQVYAFTLGASNVVGYSEASVQFEIVISTRILAFTQPYLIIDITPEGEIIVPSMLMRLLLDGSAIQRGYLTSVVTTAPDWLLLNDADLSFSAIAPNDTITFSFHISVTGRDNNAANATIVIKVSDNQTVEYDYLGALNATAGHSFVHRVSQQLGSGADVTARADLGYLASWLIFDADYCVLYGEVPSDQRADRYNISISFSSATRVVNDTITINVVKDSAIATTTLTGPTSTSTSASGNAIPHNNQNSTSPHDKLLLGLKIGLPLLIIPCLAVLLVCFRKYRPLTVERSTKPADVQPPALRGSQDLEHLNGELNTGKDAGDTSQPQLSHMPQLKLSWAGDSNPLQSHHEPRKIDMPTIKTSASSWDDLISPSSIGAREDVAMGLPNIANARHRQSRTLRPISKRRRSLVPGLFHPRSSTSSSVTSLSTIGMASRVVGAGHGAGINTTLHDSENRSSWYTTFGSMPAKDHTGGTAMLNQFPRPPSNTGTDTGGAPWTKSEVKSRIRQQAARYKNRSIEPGSFEEARQRYYTDRAKDQLEGTSRFSNSSTKSLSRSKATTEGYRAADGNSERMHPPSESKILSWSRWPVSGLRELKEFTQPLKGMKREVSMASSGQFDSALSSDSLWEDEELIAEESTAAEEGNAVSGNSSPRYAINKPSVRPEVQKAGSPEDARDTDNAEVTGQDKAEKSHTGSFRFL